MKTEKAMLFIKINSKHQIVIIFLFALFVFSAIPMVANAIPAFPGAEGFGASTTTGGRGGTVCKVTNTNDSGSGSLRHCINQTGARYIVFTTGGTITLSSGLNILPANSNVTIAGQTAPGGGIQIRNGALRISGSNVIVRGLRIRSGLTGTNDDCISIEGQ